MSRSSPPSGAPYLKSKDTAAKRTWRKALGLFPLVLAGLFFYGMPALVLMTASVGAALLSEVLMRFFLGKKASLEDGEAFVIGLTLCLLLPAGLPGWMAALGAFVAVALAREAFGGSGNHPLAPVVAGYLFLWVTFPLAMRQVLEPGTLEAAAFPMAWMEEGLGDVLAGASLGVMGPVPGAVGTVFFPAVLAGGLIVLYQRLISWEAPLLFLAAAALTAFAFGENPAEVLFLGTSVFAAFFLVPDGAGSPHHCHGLRFFALLAGFLSVFLRQVTFAFDPALAALFLVSFLSPWLDESGRPQIRKAQTPPGAVKA